MIEPSYTDANGVERQVPGATLRALADALGEPALGGPLVIEKGDRPRVGEAHIVLEDGTTRHVEDRLPADLPMGYHRLHTSDGGRSLIIAPQACFLPDHRIWGWAVQLYAARSGGSWGMGDLADLRIISEWGAAQGAGMVLVNPLGATAPTQPIEPSPYFPASRRFLNPLYLRIDDIPGSADMPGLEQARKAGEELNRLPTIDRDAVWRLKLRVLEEIWRNVQPEESFHTWRTEQGDDLVEFAIWCSLAERHGGDWRRWPAELTHPANPAVRRAKEEAFDRILFYQWLQWLCRHQLQATAQHTMVMADLPIGFDPGGADAWAWQDLTADGITMGAPPDEFNTRGQDWGIPPFVPDRLRQADYRPFIQTIRSNMSTGGGLRIDHVMGLFRQFWIPSGSAPTEGGYVRFPSSDLLSIVCLESMRAGATVVGEDLGTVGPGVREELARRRMLSYRLLWFEDQRPEHWPERSMAAVTTHDLPTVTGLWTGTDLDEQLRLDLAPNVESTRELRRRMADAVDIGDDSPPAEVVRELYGYTAQAPSRLVCASLDDAALAERRPNIPGSDPKRPNWCLPLPLSLEALVDSKAANRLAATLVNSTDFVGNDAGDHLQ